MEKKKIFISYSHDSEPHKDHVHELAEALREQGAGIVSTDHPFLTQPPPEGWPRWMESEIRKADIVLIVCTEKYYYRMQGTEKPGLGKGAKFEGALITQHIFDSDSKNTKFFPVLFSYKDVQALLYDESENLIKYIPNVLHSTNYYILNISDLSECTGFVRLIRHITEQPEYVASDTSETTVILPPKTQKKTP